jgi:hypothetical protein
MDEIYTRKHKSKNLIQKWLIIAMMSGVIMFGFILPGPLSDHDRLLHFCAHFGMSFLISYVVYSICAKKIGIAKATSFFLLVVTTLVVGLIYKYFEIQSFLPVQNLSLARFLVVTGFYISMSENLSGILAACTMILYFEKRIYAR